MRLKLKRILSKNKHDDVDVIGSNGMGMMGLLQKLRETRKNPFPYVMPPSGSGVTVWGVVPYKDTSVEFNQNCQNYTADVEERLAYGALMWGGCGVSAFLSSDYFHYSPEKKRELRINRALDSYFKDPELSISSFLEDLQECFRTIIFHGPNSRIALPLPFFFGRSCNRLQTNSHARKVDDECLMNLLEELSYFVILTPNSQIYYGIEKDWDESHENIAKRDIGVIYKRDYLRQKLHRQCVDFICEAKANYYFYQNELFETREGVQDDDVILLLNDIAKLKASLMRRILPIPVPWRSKKSSVKSHFIDNRAQHTNLPSKGAQKISKVKTKASIMTK